MNAQQLLKGYIKSITEEDLYRQWMEERKANPNPSFSADDLDLTVDEMKPGPYYPGQVIDRDKYIRENPGSGITYLLNDPQLIAGNPSFDIGPVSSKTRRDAKLRLRALSGPAYDPEVQAARRALQAGIVLPDIR